MLENKLNVLESVNTLVDEFDGRISYNEVMILYSLQCKDKELYTSIRERCKSDYYFRESIDWLLRSGYIKNNNPDMFVIGFDKLEITNPAELNRVNLLNINLTESQTSDKIEPDDFNQFVTDWYELWPVGVRTAGYLVRSGKKPVEKKLNKFIKDYPEFTPEIIMEATAQYIKRCSLKGYAFMKTASYFIIKDGESTLAGECERVQHAPPPIRETDDTKSSADDSKLL